MMAMIVLVLTVWYAVCALLVRPFGIRVPVIIWKKDYGKASGTSVVSSMQFCWGFLLSV